MLSRFHLIPERYGQTDLLYQHRCDFTSLYYFCTVIESNMNSLLYFNMKW